MTGSSKAERVADKLAHIDAQIAAVQRNAAALVHAGGIGHANMPDEIEFHQWREAILRWADQRPDAAVQARRRAIELEVGPAIVDRKYGDVRGLTDEQIDRIIEMELLDVVLGDHPIYLEDVSRV